MTGEVISAKVSKVENGKSKDRKKKKKKKAKKEKKVNQDVDVKEEEKIEIEYVAANPLEELDPNDPSFQEFANIFQRFAPEENDESLMEEESENGAAGDDDDEDGKSKVSKKQKKKEKRLSIAVLKSLVKRPDLVEAWDVTSADPGVLVYLKGYRNAVPVPRHWNQKRKYLQGKRGIEKQAFQLPDFIAATGISKIRAAIQEKEAHKKIKASNKR